MGYPTTWNMYIHCNIPRHCWDMNMFILCTQTYDSHVHVPCCLMYVRAIVCFKCACFCVCALVCVRVCPSIRSMSRSHYVRYLVCTVHPILCLGLGIYAANRSRPACVRASASCSSMCICCRFPCAAVPRTMRRSYCKLHLSTS